MNAYQNERHNFSTFETSPNNIPPERCPNKAFNSTDIDVAIYDRSHPEGLMLTMEKNKALRQALFEMMYRDLMSEADVSPKFNGSEMVNGVYRLKAVNEHSVEFLVDIVDRMPPPWPNAQLYVEYQKKKIFVEAFVPGEMVELEEVLHMIAQFDRRIRTHQWKIIGSRRLGQGLVYTFNIEPSDFEVLNTYDGFIPFNGTRIEFRVLKNPELIPKYFYTHLFYLQLRNGSFIKDLPLLPSYEGYYKGFPSRISIMAEVPIFAGTKIKNKRQA